MLCPRCSAPIKAEDEHCPECNAYLGSSDETVMLMAEDSGGTGVESPGDGNGEATEITETFATKGPVSADDLEIDETIVPAGPGQADDQKVDETLLTTGAKSIPSFGGWSEPGAPPTSGASASGTLEAGRKLGHRYEILRMLGRGGMGAVYKARDVELDRMVALKVIRPELASDPEILQRFKQEIILARDVTHRNIIRIYDLGQAEGIKFLSMEFVEGKDLHAILKEKGPLPVEEAVEIMEQVCFALEEAHETGVVHRDLKPQNIMIGPDGRVVVMDFGIARSVQVTGMTQTGSVLGTPDYMSPEQVKGQQADARSDIFALGVIFFEILTGEKPYKGDSPMAAMYKRTQDRAKSVREVNPEVPGFIGDVIARCLEIQPQKRFQSARELVHDLEIWRGGTPGTMAMTMRHLKAFPRRSRRKPILIALAALLAIALVVTGALILRRGEPEVTEQVVVAPEDVTSLAILPFRNASGQQDVAWLSTGLAEMLRADVGQSATLRSVSNDRLHQILRQLRVTPETTLDEPTRRRIAEFSNAGNLVWGQYTKLGDQIRIDATVEDVARQQSIPVKVEAANEDDLLRAVDQLAAMVRENLELSRDRIEELKDQTLRPSSQSITALRGYTEGIELVRLGSNLEAVEHFEAAIDADPAFALAYSELAQTHDLLGHDDEAAEYSRQAVELANDLPRIERNLIQAVDASITYDLERGVEAYKSLLEIWPDDSSFHYELAAIYEDMAEFDLASEHYNRVLLGDPQNISALLAAGRVLIKSGVPEEALEPLNLALSLAIETDNLEARANILQAIGVGYRFMDRFEEALASFEASLEIKRQIDDQRGMAASLGEIAIIQDVFGDTDIARESFAEAIEIRRQIGDDEGLALLLMNLGDMQRTHGHFDEALAHAREALQLQLDMGDEWNQALTLNNIGNIYAQNGQYEDSLIYLQRALDIQERLGADWDMADTLHNLGENYTILGQFEKALDHYLRAAESRRVNEDEAGEAYETFSIGVLHGLQGRYGAALASTGETLEIFRRLEEEGSWYAEVLAGYGNALGAVGKSTESMGLLDGALGLARELGDQSLTIRILNLKGDVAYYSGELEAAEPLYAEAVSIAPSTFDPLLRLASELNAAKVDVANNRPRVAVGRLRELRNETRRLGLRYLSTESSILLAKALLAQSDHAAAEAELAGIQRQLDALGAQSLSARSSHLMAEALRAQGRDDEAQRYANLASEALDEIHREADTEKILERFDLQPIIE